jgi:hypothetical protein
LFSFDHFEIFSQFNIGNVLASLIDSALIMITMSSGIATVFVWLVYLRLKSNLNCMFQKPGPQQDPCVMSVCMCVCMHVCIHQFCSITTNKPYLFPKYWCNFITELHKVSN